MALFVTLPYGKFAHGVYRGAALLKWAIERRQPSGCSWPMTERRTMLDEEVLRRASLYDEEVSWTGE